MDTVIYQKLKLTLHVLHVLYVLRHTGGRQEACVQQQGRHLIVSSRQAGASQHKTC